MMTEEKSERNQRIYDLWQSGKYKSMAAIGRQFRISRARVSEIIRMKTKKNGNGHK